MMTLFAAAATFLALHLLISGTSLRGAIVGAIGENLYLGLFSLASLASIVWLVMSYNAAVASDANAVLYDLGPGIRHLGLPVIAVAFLLGVPGLFLPNPTVVRQGAAVGKPGIVKGVLRITRHPFLWGVAIWAAFHTAANGDRASVLFFGTFLTLALLGTGSIDAKRRFALGETWSEFAAKTSNVPFAAILTGRATFSAREYFDWRFLVAVIFLAALLLAHAHLFGVSPFPNGWVPF